jgi:hypothetical protein
MPPPPPPPEAPSGDERDIRIKAAEAKGMPRAELFRNKCRNRVIALPSLGMDLGSSKDAFGSMILKLLAACTFSSSPWT